MIRFQHLILFVIAGTVILACGKTQLRKTKGGMPYQVYEGGGGEKVKAGDFVKIHITRKINDSVNYTTTETLPAYLQATATPQPYDISELWTSLRVGDSVIATQVMDTFIKRSPGNVNPKFGPGTKITYFIKVLDVFPNDSLARVDYEKGNLAWLPREIQVIEKHLAERKVTAQKTPSGTLVEMISPGTGPVIATGDRVSVNYTGTSWSGVVFDSNTDSAFQHVGPYPFVAGTGAMIKGFDEAVLMMRKGAKAKIYIPSVLAYAGSPQSPSIKPYEILKFDLEIVDVQPGGMKDNTTPVGVEKPK